MTIYHSYLRVIMLVGIYYWLGLSCAAQDKPNPTYYRVPREAVLTVSVVQPNCPLRVEKAINYGYPDGGGSFEFQLKNIGKKMIVAFEVEGMGNDGLGQTWESWKLAIKPGSRFKVGGRQGLKEIPVKEKVRKEIKSEKKIRGVLYFIVRKVKFADGTEFNETEIANRLGKFLESK